ncbi:MAG: hypothetical protein IJ776_04250 [Paludibacteraceae bacterium]|nr:hypothetical protein [Paludibacteraceae bacterium]
MKNIFIICAMFFSALMLWSCEPELPCDCEIAEPPVEIAQSDISTDSNTNILTNENL